MTMTMTRDINKHVIPLPVQERTTTLIKKIG